MPTTYQQVKIQVADIRLEQVPFVYLKLILSACTQVTYRVLIFHFSNPHAYVLFTTLHVYFFFFLKR